ncbi:hypothetical protein SSS_08651 [Sarcoptes scabiei]|uniref:Uncharacterized protein n=1 Tax=Sarcoptes scabiei TaxID=52283 RepID=A0A132AFN7_SARSC|nr:hypothetical protein SSS_08651 [Sarcoptes scabiei]KPM09753.1 hypothetical protein QR98_0082980 [Sarcoptes scabiei]
MSQPTLRFYTFRSSAETFVSIEELKSQLIRLRAVDPGTITLSSDHIEYFQAIERHLDHLKALLSSIEDLFLEKFRINLFNGNSVEEIIPQFRLFRLKNLRDHRDRRRLIRTIVAMDRTQLTMSVIYDIYQRVYAISHNSTNFCLELVERAFPQISMQ